LLATAACLLAIVLAMVAFIGNTQGVATAAGSPFEGLSGQWSGSGTLTMAGGSSERIRCRVTYQVSNGTKLQQDLRCASDSYRFDVKSNVKYEAGAISGTWTEATRNVTGTVSGSANSDQVQARVEGGGFGASMTVKTRGKQQSVMIRPHGMGVTEVAIQLSR
jgi:hypothetical protein